MVRPSNHRTGLGGVARSAVPAQDRLHPGGHLPGAERLGDVVVGTDPQAHELVDLLGAGGDQDDVHVAEGPHLAQHLKPVNAGQHHVKQHQVGRVLPHLADRRFPVGGLGHGEPFRFQVSAQHGTDVRFIVDNEHLAHRSPQIRLRPAAARGTRRGRTFTVASHEHPSLPHIGPRALRHQDQDEGARQMKLNRRQALAAVAATGVASGALAFGGVALASTSSARSPAAATAAVAAAPAATATPQPASGRCDGGPGGRRLRVRHAGGAAGHEGRRGVPGAQPGPAAQPAQVGQVAGRRGHGAGKVGLRAEERDPRGRDEPDQREHHAQRRAEGDPDQRAEEPPRRDRERDLPGRPGHRRGTGGRAGPGVAPAGCRPGCEQEARRRGAESPTHPRAPEGPDQG